VRQEIRILAGEVTGPEVADATYPSSMTRDELKVFEGRTILRIRRAFFEVGETTNRSNGLLEVTFDGGLCTVFDGASDRQSLRVEPGEWVDPFADSLSPENGDFVATSGKWSAFDVSGDAPFDRIVGALVVRVGAVLDDFGVVSGVLLETDDAALLVENRFDDFFVSVIDLV